MKGSGGTEGGLGLFAIGFLLTLVSSYLFFDSVHVRTGTTGIMTGMFYHFGHGFTGSGGIVLLPFGLGVVSLFFDASKKWAWWLTYAGLAILAVEILSRVRFLMNIKSSHLLILIATFAAGVGLMLRSYHGIKNENNTQK